MVIEPRTIYKISPRKYRMLLRGDETELMIEINLYLNKRYLHPDRCDVIIDTDNQYFRWYCLEFKNIKDTFFFDMKFTEYIKQDYTGYG